MTRDAEPTPTGYEDAASVVVNQAPAPSSLAGGEVNDVNGPPDRGRLQAIIEDAMTSAVSEPWEAAGHAADRILAALSPEAPAREGGDVPRDEKGRTAFEIIADCNRESMMRRAGVKDQSREPLLGPPSDMAVSRILLAERPEIDREAADLLAIKINDALSALTPRHEAPASEGEAVVFRDVFLSWHEECGTVERAGYGASPIGKFQNRWPGFHKKLWDAAMTSHDALRDAWVKVAKECEK